MNSEDEKVANEVKYAWRPATRGDIGSVARFCDGRSPHESWWYGILVSAEQDTFDSDIVWVYHCKHGGDMNARIEKFSFCEIQYVADDEP